MRVGWATGQDRTQHGKQKQTSHGWSPDVGGMVNPHLEPTQQLSVLGVQCGRAIFGEPLALDRCAHVLEAR